LLLAAILDSQTLWVTRYSADRVKSAPSGRNLG
jgi:hypothetical protein